MSESENRRDFETDVNNVISGSVVARRLLGEHVDEYLIRGRGLTKEIIEEWKIGYWHPGLNDTTYVTASLRDAGFGERLNGRITIPLCDLGGQPRGVVARSLPDDEHPVRYLYPLKSPYHDRRSHLFGAHRYLSHFFEKIRTIVVCEGPLDVIRLHQVGAPAVGVHSAIFTMEQALLLRALAEKVIFFPDGDETGAKMIERAKQYRSSLPDQLFAVSTPEGEDPATLAPQATTLLRTATYAI